MRLTSTDGQITAVMHRRRARRDGRFVDAIEIEVTNEAGTEAKVVLLPSALLEAKVIGFGRVGHLTRRHWDEMQNPVSSDA